MSLTLNKEMMASYYVNNNAQANGDHEVHKQGCYWLTLVVSKNYLGEYDSCNGAVKKAKETYSTANGCAYCSSSCHTS